MKRLSNLVSGKLIKAPRIVLYGVDGIGKSTFAANAPKPIFLGTEDGTAQLDVQRFSSVRTWEDVIDSIDELQAEQHEFKTLVVDTLDWLEPLVFAKVCKDGNKPDIEAFVYGKGYIAAIDLWRALLARLDGLRNTKDMAIILLAHSQMRKFQNPAGDDYDHYELKMHAKSAGVVREWADMVLFASYETYSHKDSNGKIRGVGDGSRIVHTEYRPAWDAKNRLGLPPTIGLNWLEIESAIQAGHPESPAVVAGELEKLLAAADQKIRTQAEAALKRAGDDPQKLAQLVDWLRGKVNQAA